MTPSRFITPKLGLEAQCLRNEEWSDDATPFINFPSFVRSVVITAAVYAVRE